MKPCLAFAGLGFTAHTHARICYIFLTLSRMGFSEYTLAKDVTRMRGEFFHGRLRILVVTERFHYYFRYRLRGIHQLVFYAPPSHPLFYAEFVALLRSPAGQDEVLTLYQESNALELERIVGTKTAKALLKPGCPRDVAFE